MSDRDVSIHPSEGTQAIFRAGLMPMEAFAALLHDRNVFLCGRHDRGVVVELSLKL